ncbi:MAG: DinB family protein [Chloroflexota bacterium]|nr:DinB family protein [Chloroflexota bacterium]
MSKRAQQLADQTDDAINQTIAFVENVPDDKWTAYCEPEQCTVAALASHIGVTAIGVLNALAKPVSQGEPPASITPEQIHAGNAENARKYANRPKPDVVAELRASGAEASAYVRGLSDEELQRSAVLFFRPEPVTADFIIENVLVNHSLGHLESMRAAVQ